MELGQKVASELYKEYGTSIIISKNKVFDKKYKEKILKSGDKKILGLK